MQFKNFILIIAFLHCSVQAELTDDLIKRMKIISGTVFFEAGSASKYSDLLIFSSQLAKSLIDFNTELKKQDSENPYVEIIDNLIFYLNKASYSGQKNLMAFYQLEKFCYDQLEQQFTDEFGEIFKKMIKNMLPIFNDKLLKTSQNSVFYENSDISKSFEDIGHFNLSDDMKLAEQILAGQSDFLKKLKELLHGFSKIGSYFKDPKLNFVKALDFMEEQQEFLDSEDVNNLRLFLSEAEKIADLSVEEKNILNSIKKRLYLADIFSIFLLGAGGITGSYSAYSLNTLAIGKVKRFTGLEFSALVTVLPKVIYAIGVLIGLTGGAFGAWRFRSWLHSGCREKAKRVKEEFRHRFAEHKEKTRKEINEIRVDMNSFADKVVNSVNELRESVNGIENNVSKQLRDAKKINNILAEKMVSADKSLFTMGLIVKKLAADKVPTKNSVLGAGLNLNMPKSKSRERSNSVPPKINITKRRNSDIIPDELAALLDQPQCRKRSSSVVS